MFLIDKNYWEVKETEKKGKGVFTKQTISAGSIIGDYVGKIVRLEDVDFDEEKKQIYLMYYNDKSGIYPDLNKPGIHLINHSCSPNCWMYKYNNHTLFFALRKIKQGDELTISYLLPPKKYCKPCTHKCYCKSKDCTRSMHLTEEKYRKWQEFEDKEFMNTGFKGIRNELKPLNKYPKLISERYIRKIEKLFVE